MTDGFFASINGAHCTRLSLFASWGGPWYLDAILDDVAAKVAGKVMTTIGSLSLVGTVRPDYSGNFVQQRSLRIVGGGGRWGKELPAKGYHSDSGVSFKTLATDAAREAGETLGTVSFGPGTVGASYLRPAGLASDVLDRLLAPSGGVWWVGQDGLTYCGKRPTSKAKEGSYTVQAYSPQNRTVDLACLDPAAVWVGSILTDRLSEPQTIRELELHLEAGKMVMRAWTGGSDDDSARIDKALKALIDKQLNGRILGKWLYKVVSMRGNRANLQVVRTAGSARSLPDALPVSINCGLPGCWAQLTPGSRVWVEFGQGGDPTFPIITAFADKDAQGYLPQTLELCVGNGETGYPAAHVGSVGEAFFPPESPITGTVSGAPFVGTITLLNSVPVIITSGSNRVLVGSG